MTKSHSPIWMLCLIPLLFCLSACADPLSSTPETTKAIQTTEVSETTAISTPSWESRLTALFQDTDQAGLTIEDLTFFGTSIVDLSLEDAIAIAQQNGFTGEFQEEDGVVFFKASSPNGPSPSIGLTYYEGKNNTFTEFSYYHSVPDGEFSGRYETDTPVWIGIRDIYTFDSLETVLGHLHYSNSAEIAAAIREILSLPSEEALAILRELHSYGFSCEAVGYRVYADTDRLTTWSFLWKATDSLSQKQYTVEFHYLVEDDCLTGARIWIQ